MWIRGWIKAGIWSVVVERYLYMSIMKCHNGFTQSRIICKYPNLNSISLLKPRWDSTLDNEVTLKEALTELERIRSEINLHVKHCGSETKPVGQEIWNWDEGDWQTDKICIEHDKIRIPRLKWNNHKSFWLVVVLMFAVGWLYLNLSEIQRSRKRIMPLISNLRPSFYPESEMEDLFIHWWYSKDHVIGKVWEFGVGWRGVSEDRLASVSPGK